MYRMSDAGFSSTGSFQTITEKTEIIKRNLVH